MHAPAGLLLILCLLLAACGGGDEAADAGGQGDLAVASEVDADWGRSPVDLRGNDGTRYGWTCPPGGEPGSLWGTGPFTDDSSVCTAAVFAGLITLSDGGRVVIEILPGEDAYEGGEAGGVSASEWPSWPGSFDFPEA